MRKGILAGILALSLSTSVGGCANFINKTEKSGRFVHQAAQMCVDSKYDLDTRCISSYDAMDAMTKSVYPIVRKVKYDLSQLPKSLRERLNKRFQDGYIPRSGGSAVMLEDGYMLTANHVLGPKKPGAVLLRTGFFNYVQLKPLDRKYFVTIKGKEYATDFVVRSKKDVALIHLEGLPKGMEFPKVRFGKLKDVRQGNLIYSVGNSLLQGVQVKTGIVSKKGAFSEKIMKSLKKREERMKGLYTVTDSKHFVTEVGTLPGDSGGAGYALRDGKPELVSIHVMGHRRAHGLFGVELSIDSVMEALGDTFMTHGLYYGDLKDIMKDPW